MGHIQKLPIILGCSAAIVTGFVSYFAGTDSQGIYLRMAGMMLLFFIIGTYIRNTIISIREEVLNRKIREHQEEKERQKRSQPSEHERQIIDQPHQVDLTADNREDSFEPLTVSRAIRTKMNG